MAKKVAALCEARSKGFSPHTWTNGIGLLHNLHLACGVPNCDILEYPYEEPGWVPEARDAMLQAPPRPKDGCSRCRRPRASAARSTRTRWNATARSSPSGREPLSPGRAWPRGARERGSFFLCCA